MKKLNDIGKAKDTVKNHVDIFRVISDDIDDGTRVWKNEGKYRSTHSPFRDERTPSFKIDDHKFVDFGGENYSGDVFAWVMLWHALSFPESIVYLAEKYNVDINQFIRNPSPEELTISRYKQINKYAVEFMQEAFKANPNNISSNYLSTSGFTYEMIEPYQVGYSPSKHEVVNYIHSKMQISEEDVYKLEFNRGDLFDNTIVYPIHNSSGEVLGFYSAQVDKTKARAKYIGTKNAHPLHDRSVLYGMHVVKKLLRTTGPVIRIVEGFRDAIACKAVGVMGSSISKEQIKVLQDYNIRKVIVCYDGDATGFQKTKDLAQNPDEFGDILVSISRPSDDSSHEDKIDPHEVFRRWGVDAVNDMFNAAVTPLEFFLNNRFPNISNLSITEKYQILSELRDYFVKLHGTRLYIDAGYISKLIDCPSSVILDHIAELKVQEANLFNLEAERVVIANSMQSSVEFNTFKASGIHSNCFTLGLYKIIFEACQIAFDKFTSGYTAQVVVDEVMARHLYTDFPNTASKILSEEFKYEKQVAGEIVLDMWRRRVASEQGKALVSAARDMKTSFTEILQTHRQSLVSSISSYRKQANTPIDVAKKVHLMVEERSKKKSPIIGYDFGSVMRNLNIALGGIQTGHNIVISGETGAGKSICALNIVRPIAFDLKIPTLWLRLEMDEVENGMRAFSILGGIDNTKLQSGIIEDQSRYATALTKYAQSEFYTYAPQAGTEEEFLSIIDEFRFKYGIKVVVLDYIQMVRKMASQKNMARHEIIDSCSKMFKQKISVDMGIASIIITQMNRDKMSRGTQKVGGSIALSQDADDFIEISVKSKEQQQKDGGLANRYINVHKRRGGASDVLIHAFYDDARGRTLRLTEADPPNHLAANMIRNG